MGNTATTEFLVWQAGEHHFALDLTECREIIQDTTVATVPHAPESVAGVANIRGAVLAIYDLPVLLGYEKVRTQSKSPAIVRVKQQLRDFGISADSVSDVIAVAQDKIRNLPGNFSEQEARFIRAIAVLPEKIALVIRPGAFEAE